MTCPEGNNEFLFSKDLNISEIKSSQVTTSRYLQLHAPITCSSGQTVAADSDLFPVGRHSFRNVARSWHLAVITFIVRCHVIMN